MIKTLFFIVVPVLAISCVGRHKSDADKVVANPEAGPTHHTLSDTLRMHMTESTIDWTTTQMRGTRIRTGTIAFNDGYLLAVDGEIAGGEFTVDMESMDVTDVPLHESIARRNLLDHLKSDDFFNVAEFPLSTLVITGVEKHSHDLYGISANLSIREVTKNITFQAHKTQDGYTTRFVFNRFDWNIAYEGSWADKTLIDKEVELKIGIALIN